MRPRNSLLIVKQIVDVGMLLPLHHQFMDLAHCTLRQFYVSNNCYSGSLFPLTVDQSQGQDVIYQLELVTLISEPLTDLCSLCPGQEWSEAHIGKFLFTTCNMDFLKLQASMFVIKTSIFHTFYNFLTLTLIIFAPLMVHWHC